MPDSQHEIHFGLNCRLLRRDPYSPADYRCSVAIESYSVAKYSFLNTKTAVPIEVAARFLGLPKAEVIRRAKAGKLEYIYPSDISKRITLYTKSGPRQFTLTEASKKMRISLEDIERRIHAGEIEAFYPDELMQVLLINRWEYEKCPLVDTGGQCYDFQPHDGSNIRCIADAAKLRDGLV